MIGKNYNKTHQEGQVLLITVMLLATAITIVMTVAFNTTTESQIGLLEQESQKALSAAEAGLELALKKVPGSSIILGGAGSNLEGITGQADVLSIYSPTFVSPLVQRDESYTFYLGTYQTDPPLGPRFIDTDESYFNGNIFLYFGEKACEAAGNPIDGAAVEITQVKRDNSLYRYLIDPCNYFHKTTASLGVTQGVYTVEDTRFSFKSDAIITANTKLLMVRVLYNGSKVAIVSSDTNKKFPLQGKTVVSEAKTDTGVTKRIQLFQSYPQIPTDFIVTGF